MTDLFAPYRAYLASRAVDVERYRYGAAERDDILLGALVAMDLDLELSPLDHEREFWPAVDAGFGEVATLVANLLVQGRAVIPNSVATQVAGSYQTNMMAAIARSSQVTSEDAGDRQAAADLVRCWTELAGGCAAAWLRGAGHPDQAVARLDGLFGLYSVDAVRAITGEAPYRVVYQVEVLSERPFDPGSGHPRLRDLADAAEEQAATVIIREQVHELTFKLITEAPWHPAAIERIAGEFNQRYGGNLAVESAYLAEARLVDSPADPE
jgi:hypothetical protein